MTESILKPGQISYAHSLPGKAPDEWESLDCHSEAVGRYSQEFAAAFGAGAWGLALGRCHDLGKASAEFQQRMLLGGGEAANLGEEDSIPARVDHSTFGARYLKQSNGGAVGLSGWLLAYAAAGHHAGLANWSSDNDSDRGTLSYRLSSHYTIPSVPDPILSLEQLEPWKPDMRDVSRPQLLRRTGFSYALFTRMLFSCLVDADRLCTEEFCDLERALERRESRPGLLSLWEALDAHLQTLHRNAPDTEVNAQRRSVLSQCLDAASSRRGFFSLQVPTGGGKTLASLAFALRHALHSESLQRVIVAIPFTSIIEQTADAYREALGENGRRAIVEHHTNIQPTQDTRANQFAAENWDAPLIVTTNVQLFESLFAARTTPCRKLHNIANSVIILDEAQTLPVELLEPTLASLHDLVSYYGCSIVLCTATQPALEQRDAFSIGFKEVRPIIANPQPLFDALRRVQVKSVGPLSDAALSQRLALEPRVLCIVNTRAHALRLYEALRARCGEEGMFHLSTLMCGAHRRAVLAEIRQCLTASHLPVRIISTQLIEAGVDIDLPVVYRASAGIDSIAQAAGRCNREGYLPMGYTYVFEAEQKPPPGFLRQAEEVGREVLRLHEADPLCPGALLDYFRQLYWRKRDEWDKKEVMAMTELVSNGAQAEPHFQFRRVAEEYQFIQTEQLSVLIPFDKEARKYSRQLESGFVEWVRARELQRYLVNIPRRSFDSMVASGVVLEHASGVGLLLREDAYSDTTGLQLDEFGLDPLLWGM